MLLGLRLNGDKGAIPVRLGMMAARALNKSSAG